MEDEEDHGPEEGNLLIRIHVPELNVQKCLQFPRDQLVWDVKQQCLAALPKELKESFNYGLFCPPENGRAGKFLDEERRLGDYPFHGPVGHLELKYKRRVYKMITLDEKQLKNLHTRANFKRLIDYVQNGQVEKITKMCSKGLDPNFHCQDSGETPLTLATAIKKPSKVIIALVNGGALLDYRTKDGSTALHRAIEHRSLEAMKTLLELGASPNYKDGKGLTPLYLTVTHNVDPQFTETLLHDHATIGAQDSHGWHEVHQACKTAQLQHLEHLLFYSADMNARNASGNTPLHVCAVNNQISCARTLLFRGADRNALNFANQTPYQVAVIAQNMELAELIQNYKNENVVPYRGPPSYNPKRRSGIGWLTRAPSMGTLNLPPSPCPSDRSSALFSSASSSFSDGSTHPGHETDSASIVTDKSFGDTSDIISDSSGVGTANSDTTNCSIALPGTTVVCIESYSAKEGGHISIREGDIIEVTGATDEGYLEGNLRSGGIRSGIFPAHCVQEVKLRQNNIQAPLMLAKDPKTINKYVNSRVLGRRESTSNHFATTPRLKKSYGNIPGEARTVVLHKGRKGFGFILRGAKATSPLMELTPSEKCPALQYLDDVDPGGVADMAGLKKGDFLLEINNEDVSAASHEHVVDLIRKSGNLVQMTVVSLEPDPSAVNLPTSKSTILPGENVEVPISRQYATLPRKVNSHLSGSSGRSSQAPLPPRRDPKTTLSVGRARAKSLVAGLGEKDESEDVAKSSSIESMHQNLVDNNSSSVQLRTASIKQRPSSSRITSAELEKLFHTQRDTSKNDSAYMCSSRFVNNTNTLSHPASPAKTRVYASVAEMKRSRSKSTKVRFTSLFAGGDLNRNFHSTPDLVQEVEMSGGTKRNRSQEDLALLFNRSLPPPTHPPPPPPPTSSSVHVVTLDVGRSRKLDRDASIDGIASSFNPTANAKLYASPEDMKSVGYRSKSLPSNSSRSQLRKSHSMRTSKLFISTTAPVTENSNPYAQPVRATRSYSNAGGKERRKRPSSGSKTPTNSTQTGVPVIPDPDYSCSDSASESETEPKEANSTSIKLNTAQMHSLENSGNSNTSGSSSASTSVPHSFSVEEIQKGRLLLKSSKSYPDDFLKKKHESDANAGEDGDNSSSGVSSDQENHSGSNHDYTDKLHTSVTFPAQKPQKHSLSSQSRHAVSLVQLPPPIEHEQDEKEEFCLPPPPEFESGLQNLNSAPDAVLVPVLAPPPQFSDNRQVTRVRVVGTVPKGVTVNPKVKQGRLNSQ